MTNLRLCLQNQTPLVRLARRVPDGARLKDLEEGVDYFPSPGGVTRMLGGLITELTRERHVSQTDWMSLSRDDARIELSRHATLDFVTMERRVLETYATAKGALWEGLHELPLTFGIDLYAIGGGLHHLAQAMRHRLCRRHEETPVDLVYVHDFQLLEASEDRGVRVPHVFRWHVPVAPVARDVRDYVVRRMNKFDAVIVSTRGYANRLRSWGVRAPIHASYPYLGTDDKRIVTKNEIARFDEKFGLKPSDVAFTLVARLDPMKNQDVALRAMARVVKQCPDAKLLLIGGGGFSGGKLGLGLPQSDSWRGQLEGLVRALKLEDHVVFTGTISDQDLAAAYARSRATILPSSLEGFGLAPVEAWAHSRPVITSTGCGVSEIVREGENGYTFSPQDESTLAAHMLRLARDPAHADLLGREGLRSSAQCSLKSGTGEVWKILDGVLHAPHARWKA